LWFKKSCVILKIWRHSMVFDNISTYTMLVTVLLTKKKGPNTFCFGKSQTTFNYIHFMRKFSLSFILINISI
jgi:hypothetical protein